MRLAREVVWVARGREGARQADVVVRVVGADVGRLDDRVERVDHVVPDSVGTRVLGRRRRAPDGLAGRVVRLDHGELVLGHAERRPEERLGADHDVADQRAEERRPDLGMPHLPLLRQSLGLEQLRDRLAAPEDARDPPEHADRVLAAARVVEAAAVGLGEDAGVVKPVLERAARQMRGQLGQQQRPELGVLALAKDLPKVFVRQRRVRGDLELQEMVLARVEVDGVDPGGALHSVREDVVAGAGDGENHVVRAELE